MWWTSDKVHMTTKLNNIKWGNEKKENRGESDLIVKVANAQENIEWHALK